MYYTITRFPYHVAQSTVQNSCDDVVVVYEWLSQP